MVKSGHDEFNAELLLRRIAEGMIPMHNLLGIELLHIEPDFVSFKIPFNEKLIGDILNKRIHGGIISAAMDAVGGAVAMLNFKSFEDHLSTINITVNYLRPAFQKNLIIEGRSIKNGVRVIFTEMKAFHEGEADKTIATGSASYSYKQK